MKIFFSAMLCIICASCHIYEPYKGRPLTNQIDVGREYALEDIKEIKAFYATYLRSKGSSLIHYAVYLDPHSDYSKTSGPHVRLVHNGEPTAVFWPKVSDLRELGEDALIVEWETDANVDPISFFYIQFYPNTDKMVSVRLNFSQAKCAFQDGDNRDGRQMNLSFQDLLNIARQTIPNIPSQANDGTNVPQPER